MNSTTCIKCGKALHPDEEGLCQKLLGRDTSELLCVDCLSVKLGTDSQRLLALIEHYREEGCQLFTPKGY